MCISPTAAEAIAEKPIGITRTRPAIPPSRRPINSPGVYPGVYGVICGAHVNASSQKKAEELAPRGCEAGLKKFKFRVMGRCSIFVSK